MGLVLTVQPSILGTGFAFPFQLDAAGAYPLITSEEDLVKRSLIQLVTTRKGERPFLVKGGIPYGTSIDSSIFENVDQASDIITFEVPQAITIWEPRVIVGKTTVQAIPAANSSTMTLYAKTSFTFRATNRVDNFVIPYLLQAYQGGSS